MNDQGHDIMSSNAHQFLPRPKRISKLSQVSAGASRAKVSTMLISAPDDHALEELKKPGYKFLKVTQEKLQKEMVATRRSTGTDYRLQQPTKIALVGGWAFEMTVGLCWSDFMVVCSRFFDTLVLDWFIVLDKCRIPRVLSEDIVFFEQCQTYHT